MEIDDRITILPRKNRGDPDVLMVSVFKYPPEIESLRTLVLGSSSSVRIPTPWEKENTRYLVSCNSCDGLVCLYHPLRSGYVVNPATRWYRPQFQLRMSESDYGEEHIRTIYKLGFGKDIVTGTYKAVFLYNNNNKSSEEENRCEVFDFRTNTWRYVTPAAPYQIVGVADPVFVDGSLHWFTDCWDETKLVSFDLHTEDFQVISKSPLAMHIVITTRSLCAISDMNGFNQVIWSFDSGNKTRDKICSIDLQQTRLLYV